MNRRARRAAGASQAEVRRDAARQWFATALDRHQAGRLAEAANFYARSLRQAPEAETYYNLGLALMQMAKVGEAADAWRAACRARPGYGLAATNLAVALAELDQPAEAQTLLRQVAVLQPDWAEPYNNLAILQGDAMILQPAIVNGRRALQIDPDYADAHNSLGILLHQQGNLSAAADSYRSALRLNPDFAKAHFNLGLTLLRMGILAEGWRHYAWRWRGGARHLQPRPFGKPLCQGETLPGQRLLLHAEQGFGDTLQFVRFIAQAAARGAHILLEAPRPLLRLLESVDGVAELLPTGSALPAFDCHLPLMSLAGVLGIAEDGLSAAVPYLHPDPGTVALWQSRLAAGSGPRVGLVWSGDPRRHDPRARTIDARRSLPLEALSPLLAVPGISFVSLQLGEAAGQLAALPDPSRITDATSLIGDFADSAALLATLDLVITVDTAMAHLAGAIGCPVWILSRFDGCWRWLEGRDDSPWYPSARLFRQTSSGDWTGVVARVAAALGEWALRNQGDRGKPDP